MSLDFTAVTINSAKLSRLDDGDVAAGRPPSMRVARLVGWVLVITRRVRGFQGGVVTFGLLLSWLVLCLTYMVRGFKVNVTGTVKQQEPTK